MSDQKRNYKREYALYHSKPLQKKRRAQRNSARKKLEKLGRVHKGDGKDVDHKNRNRNGNLSNSISNLRTMIKSRNRARNSRPYP